VRDRFAEDGRAGNLGTAGASRPFFLSVDPVLPGLHHNGIATA